VAMLRHHEKQDTRREVQTAPITFRRAKTNNTLREGEKKRMIGDASSDIGFLWRGSGRNSPNCGRGEIISQMEITELSYSCSGVEKEGDNAEL